MAPSKRPPKSNGSLEDVPGMLIIDGSGPNLVMRRYAHLLLERGGQFKLELAPDEVMREAGKEIWFPRIYMPDGTVFEFVLNKNMKKMKIESIVGAIGIFRDLKQPTAIVPLVHPPLPWDRESGAG